MKTVYAISTALLFVSLQSRAEIIAGPITNPVNGHDYYLLTQNTWTASEAEAEQLGGRLAVIKNAAEQEWVFSKFGSYGGTNRNLWIGLHRQWQGGPFAWVTDEKVNYVNWGNGQPDNNGGMENCTEMWSDNHGYWNDTVDAMFRCGLVEVPGKSNEKSLTEKEKSLIGNWYEGGKPDRQAWIVGTDNLLFLITHDRHAARLVFTPEGLVYDADRQYGEIIKDRILWGNGSWWSRKPAEYRTAESSPDKNIQPPSGNSMD